MQIFNVRFGLATNSSSSHSLIFLKEDIRAYNYSGLRTDSVANPDLIPQIANDEFGDFGWSFFTAASPQWKSRYLGILLRDRLQNLLPMSIANLIIKDWLDGIRVNREDYIDHQSWYCLPYAFGTNVPDEQFFKALKEYFLDDRLVILGGNDNESFGHPLDDGNAFTLPLPQDGGRDTHYTCRYDEASDYWSIFEQKSGTKIRFRLNKGEPSSLVAPGPLKSTAPELVDIKITDYCPFGCDFCYMSSTMIGEHADYYEIYDLAIALAKLKVFEVALGGGEPTLHPNFGAILQQFRRVGIVPNFTTRNIGWLRDRTLREEILKYCGSFAVSMNKESQVWKLLQLLEEHGVDKSRVNIHIVMGTIDQWAFLTMLKACSRAGLAVTLLGYKDYGFGAEYNRTDYGWWLKYVKQVREAGDYVRISIDTVLAAEYEKEILAADVPKWMFTTEEGKFSCYIDAVKKKIGPSSFCGEDKMIALAMGWARNTADDITAAYASF